MMDITYTHRLLAILIILLIWMWLDIYGRFKLVVNNQNQHSSVFEKNNQQVEIYLSYCKNTVAQITMNSDEIINTLNLVVKNNAELKNTLIQFKEDSKNNSFEIFNSLKTINAEEIESRALLNDLINMSSSLTTNFKNYVYAYEKQTKSVEDLLKTYHETLISYLNFNFSDSKNQNTALEESLLNKLYENNTKISTILLGIKNFEAETLSIQVKNYTNISNMQEKLKNDVRNDILKLNEENYSKIKDFVKVFSLKSDEVSRTIHEINKLFSIYDQTFALMNQSISNTRSVLKEISQTNNNLTVQEKSLNGMINQHLIISQNIEQILAVSKNTTVLMEALMFDSLIVRAISNVK